MANTLNGGDDRQALAQRQRQEPKNLRELMLPQPSDLTKADEGVCSLDLIGTPLTNEDFVHLVEAIKVVQFDPSSPSGLSEQSQALVTVLFADLIADKWSRERFEATMRKFRKTMFFGRTWSLGQFYKCSPENDLRPHSWVELECHLHGNKASSMMEGFAVPQADGSLVTMYRYKGTGPVLPFKRVHPK
jgi:hypothetical protein